MLWLFMFLVVVYFVFVGFFGFDFMNNLVWIFFFVLVIGVVVVFFVVVFYVIVY